MTKKYALGLDVGTNSVGWAVVDETGEIVKKNGKSLWGVRLFEESQSAQSRRGFRSSRRRLARRNHRIMLLRNIFASEILSVDSTFFERLDDSFAILEDKRNKNKYTLFNSTEYSDKTYFEEFPTIYHLRQYLLNSHKKEDIRFLYLALHHMIKYRGNFLTSGEDFNVSDLSRIKEIILNLNIKLVDNAIQYEDYSDYFESINFDYTKNDAFLNQFIDIMKSTKTKNDKKNLLMNHFKVSKKSFVHECIIPLLVGGTCSLNKLSFIKDMEYEKCELSLVDEKYEEQLERIRNEIPELNSFLDSFLEIKEIIGHSFLVDLLDNNKYLSDAMVKQYDYHKLDLKKLKSLIKCYAPNKYNECFRNLLPKNNYVNYIGMISSSKKMTRMEHCKIDEFYSYLKGIFDGIKDAAAQKEITYFREKMDNQTLLLRQNSNQNGILPMQLNLAELKIILHNQSPFYPFLKEADDKGITNLQKIIEIFKFKIPYYVGPLHPNAKNYWLKRNSNEIIYPWNYKEIINLDETAKEFIERMQRKCTYLKGLEDYCLPKASIYFSRYTCLCYVNKLYLNGASLPPNIKEIILEDFFMKVKNPTKKQLIKFMISHYGEDCKLTTSNGKDLEEINCNMNSWIAFNKIFEDNLPSIETIESIIKDIVVFEDKFILEKRLASVYLLKPEIVKQIKSLNYKGYSNLSKKFLVGIPISHSETGEVLGSFLDIMENTNLNLQEILYHPDYRYMDIIEKENKQILGEEIGDFRDFIDENIYVSPIMKRPLIQSYLIIEEVEKILHTKIDKYYIECARTKEKTKRSKSRYEKIKELLMECKNIVNSVHDLDVKDLSKKLEENKDKLRSDKVYLYFTQLGKCMYTLENIDFEDIMDNKKYDIDHIYPQSLIKDDSFNNTVLVKKTKNEEKSDRFIFEITSFLSKDSFKFYELLLNHKFITKEKYRRLTKKIMDKKELDGFVNRQIVATNQAVKGLVELLKLFKKVDSNNIIYSKAEIVSQFRNQFDLYKSRTANNYHHAHDAYLNVIVGGVLDKYYKMNHYYRIEDYYRLKSEFITLNPKKIFEKDCKIGKTVLWEKDKMISKIKYNLYHRYDILETLRTYNSNDMFSKITILPKGKGNIPIKTTDFRKNIDKYGGLTSYSYSKYALVKIQNKKGMEEYILESIPKTFEKEPAMYEYLKKLYKNFIIIEENIKINSLVQEGTLKYYITGRSGHQYNIKNASDRNFDYKCIKIIHTLEKYMDNLKNKNAMPKSDNAILVSVARNDDCKDIVITLKDIDYLYNDLMEKYSKSIYSFSNINNVKEKLRDNFKKLAIEEKIKVLCECLILLKTNERGLADLRDILSSKNSGNLSINKKLKKGMRFIAKSVTGYYEKIIFEVPK